MSFTSSQNKNSSFTPNTSKEAKDYFFGPVPPSSMSTQLPFPENTTTTSTISAADDNLALSKNFCIIKKKTLFSKNFFIIH